MPTLYIDETNTIQIHSVEHLVDILSEIKSKYIGSNPYVQLIHDNGNIVGLGISSEGCYAMYTKADNQPPYFSSLGTSKITDEVIEFDMFGYATEIPKFKTISFGELEKVARKFYLTGKFPSQAINWIQD